MANQASQAIAPKSRSPVPGPGVKTVDPDFKPPGLKRPQGPPKGEVPISPESPEEGALETISLDSFEKEQGYPYATDYYQLDTPYEFVDSGMQENLETIDTFVQKQLEDKGAEPTLKNYARMLKTTEKQLGIDDSTLRNLAIIKMSNLARNFNLVLDAFSKTVRSRILTKLLKMANAGYSGFDQKEFILEKLGGLI